MTTGDNDNVDVDNGYGGGEEANDVDDNAGFDLIHRVNRLFFQSSDEDDDDACDENNGGGCNTEKPKWRLGPYEKYREWRNPRGWQRHPLYVIILGG